MEKELRPLSTTSKLHTRLTCGQRGLTLIPPKNKKKTKQVTYDISDMSTFSHYCNYDITWLNISET